MAAIYAKRALAKVGAPFRPQGRDPGHGMDCVGLCLAAYQIPPEKVRCDYRIRGDHRREVMTSLLGWFRRIGGKQARPGDLMLLSVASNQIHLAVRTDQGFVHADAGLRRVVHTPGSPPWAVIGVYRRRAAPPPLACGESSRSTMPGAWRPAAAPSPSKFRED